MLKHKEIIDLMSIKQKISLLTNINCLSEPEFTALGIPFTSISSLEDMLNQTGEGISSNILARSWDTDKIRSATKELVELAKENGTNFVISPSPKIKINPYKSAISEDGFLSGEIVGAYLSAIHNAGVPACVSGLSLDSDDVDYLDLIPNQRILREYFIAPFKSAAMRGECHSVIASVDGPGNGYENANLKLMLAAETGLFETNMNVLCNEHTPEATAEVWHAGGIVMSGVASVLEEAHDKYDNIVRAIHEGHATVNDLEDAYADGSAISDDMIDAAVSRVIDFAFLCNSEIQKEENIHLDIAESVLEDNQAAQEENGHFIAEEMCNKANNDESETIKTEDTSIEMILDNTSNDSNEKVDEDADSKVAEQTNDDPNDIVDSDKLLDVIKESIVLLKNDNGLLPMERHSNFAIIGDMAMSAANAEFASNLSFKLGSSCVGSAKGYELNSDKNEALIRDAVELAVKADVILLFLGIDSKRLDKISSTKRLELPANQAALLSALRKFGHKIVAVVNGDVLPASNLDEDIAALVLAPIGGTKCACALADILCGEKSPAGRLTESYYDSPDSVFETIRINKEHKVNKIGPFMGYCHYDSSMKTIRYPFGYGLSYTSFEYSNLNVNENEVAFTLCNTGDRVGIETVQLYVGKNDSKFIRPLKVLKSFAKIELEPGESKEVKLDIVDLSIYDDETKKFIVEGGEYQIYIGSSVSDIRLSGEMVISGTENVDVRDRKEKSSDYLLSQSNITLDKYTLETRGKQMKRSNKWMISYIAGIALALIVNAILIAAKIGSNDDLMILGGSVLTLMAIFNLFAIAFIGFAIFADYSEKKKYNSWAKIADDKVLQFEFSDATVVDEKDIEDLFVKEFDEKFETKLDTKPRRGFDLSDYSKFVDSSMNFMVAQRSLEEHAIKCGISITPELSANVLASLSASRMLLVNSSDADKTRRFTRVLCNYFGTEEYAEQIDNTYIDGNLLITRAEDGTIANTSFANMLKNATENKEKIHFITLTDLTDDLISNLFARYIRFLNNPERECVVVFNDEKIVVPENVWFLVSMKEGENIQSLPVYMAELITTINVDFKEVQTNAPSDEEASTSELPTLGYYQLSFMSEKSRNGFAMSEDMWKRVDSLEGYASKRSSYRFGNKMWLKLEKYLSVLNSCEFELKPALDYTLNANIVHVLQIVLNGKLEDDDKGILDAIELFFGEDNVPVCRNTLKGVSLT